MAAPMPSSTPATARVPASKHMSHALELQLAMPIRRSSAQFPPQFFGPVTQKSGPSVPSEVMVEMSRSADHMLDRSNSLQDARMHHFRPGPRLRQGTPRESQKPQQTKEEKEELKANLIQAGDQAEVLLRSLAFRSWALNVAEAAREVADFSMSSGMRVCARSRHIRIVHQLLGQCYVYRRRALLRLYILWWTVAICGDAEGPSLSARRIVASMCMAFFCLAAGDF
jgi:hypothetical protein